MIHKKKNQSTEADPELTSVLELADQNIKAIIIHDRSKKLNRDMKNTNIDKQKHQISKVH